MKKAIIIVSILLGYLLNSTAQQGVQIGEVFVLATEMTEAQRNAIATPDTALLIYQTDGTMGLYYYTGTNWISLNTCGTSTPWVCDLTINVLGSSGTIITTSANGGTPPYTYQWGPLANNQTTASATGLQTGIPYTVTFTDVNGCTDTLTQSLATWGFGVVHCNGTPTVINDVVSITGKTWMDRNLGATQVGTSSTDNAAFGDYWQWGRFSDGHQCLNSGTTSYNARSTSAQPGHGLFIRVTNSPYNWLYPHNNNLWQGVDGINNPCPSGYRLPTAAEWDAETLTWSSANDAGAFASPLKLVSAKYRTPNQGVLSTWNYSYYWSGNHYNADRAHVLMLSSGNAYWHESKAGGRSVRCIKD